MVRPQVCPVTSNKYRYTLSDYIVKTFFIFAQLGIVNRHNPGQSHPFPSTIPLIPLVPSYAHRFPAFSPLIQSPHPFPSFLSSSAPSCIVLVPSPRPFSSSLLLPLIPSPHPFPSSRGEAIRGREGRGEGIRDEGNILRGRCEGTG